MSATEQRTGEWMQTYTGRRFWPMDPRPEDICIEDIAHHLSLICRYNGACIGFYSVAQHSVHVSEVVEAEGHGADRQLWGLLHDAAEAYIGDMVRPLKRSMPAYRDAEREIMGAVRQKFGLIYMEPPCVKRADTVLLSTERRDLLSHELDWNADELVPPMEQRIVPYAPPTAEAMFRSRFRVLTAQLEAQAVG